MNTNPMINTTCRGVRYPNGRHGYEVVVGERVIHLDALQHLDNPKESWKAMMVAGVALSRARRTALASMIDEIDDFIDVDLASRVGWNGDHFFALPSGEVIAPTGITAPKSVFLPISGRCNVAGDQDGFNRTVTEPLAGHCIPEFLMTVPFAGPMRALSPRVENFAFDLFGKGGTGKSSLLSCQAALIGGGLGGVDGSFGLSFATTPAGLESEMRNFSDLYMSIDEGNLFGIGMSPASRGKALMQLIMSLGRGEEKTRFNAPGNTFRFTGTYTGNESSYDIVGGSNSKVVAAAMADRAIGISLEGRPFGIFDFVPDGYDDPADCIASVLAGLEANHGTAMRIFLQKLVDARYADEEQLRARIQHHVARFRTFARIESNNGSARRVADAFGYVVAAGLFAQYAGALPASYDIMNSALECYRIFCSGGRQRPLVMRQLEQLANDPGIIDLDTTPLPHLSDEEVASAPGFIKTQRSGVRELLVHPKSIARNITDWIQSRRHFEVKRLLCRSGERHLAPWRQVRAGQRDRMVCLNLEELLPRRSPAAGTKRAQTPEIMQPVAAAQARGRRTTRSKRKAVSNIRNAATVRSRRRARIKARRAAAARISR